MNLPLSHIQPPKLTPKETAQREALRRAPRPKTAATLILWKGPRDNPSILMGQRASRHDFMPSIYVFPGGRVDRADSYAPYTGKLSARTQHILKAAKISSRKSCAVILAAVRETYEETSLMLGTAEPTTRNPKHESYQAFFEAGLKADISGIEVIGRAITPPHRHKRFDTWFFSKDMNGAGDMAASDSHELLNVDWFTQGQIKGLKTHSATDAMLAVHKRYLAQDNPPSTVFFLRQKRGRYITSDFPQE